MLAEYPETSGMHSGLTVFVTGQIYPNFSAVLTGISNAESVII